MNARHVFLTLAVLLCCGFVNPAWAYVATFDNASIDGVYSDVDGSGVDVTCVSINDGFIYLSSGYLLSGAFDHAYAGDYDYDYADGIVGSGVWMMDDHIPGDVQSSIIEFSDDVYFEQIWFAQAGDHFPVQGDVARITAYAADSTGEHDWLYQASVSFDSTDDFNQWFPISPVPGFEDVAIRKLVLTYSNINYGVWDHLVFSVPKLSFAGEIVAWGSNTWSGSYIGQCDVPTGVDFVAVSSGPWTSFGLKSDGSWIGWGMNNNGQLEVPAGYNFVDVQGGEWYTVGLLSNGGLIAWGDNSYGWCDVPQGSFIRIEVGWCHNFAFRANGSIVAWGSNDYGQIDIPSNVSFADIAAGSGHTVGLKTDGSLLAWGDNSYGECDVPEGNDYVAVTAGSQYSVALKSDGSLAAWGLNSGGQCDIPQGNDFVNIVAGGKHTVATMRNGGIIVWGDNDYEVPEMLADAWISDLAVGHSHNLALISRGVESHCNRYPPMDFNFDCRVDFGDLAVFAQYWLDCNLEPKENCWD